MRRALEIAHLLARRLRLEEVAFERLKRTMAVNWEADEKNLEVLI